MEQLQEKRIILGSMTHLSKSHRNEFKYTKRDPCLASRREVLLIPTVRIVMKKLIARLTFDIKKNKVT